MDLEAFSVNGVQQIRARMFAGNLENKPSFLILDPPSHQQSDDLHKKNHGEMGSTTKWINLQRHQVKIHKACFVELLGGWPW